MKRSLLIIMVLALVVAGCQKYEENTVSVLSLKSHVVNTWKIDKYTISDGYDFTWYFADYTITFGKDNKYTERMDGEAYTGTWDFDTEKEKLVLTPDGSTYRTVWLILKLKKDAIWIRSTDEEYYEIQFKPNK